MCDAAKVSSEKKFYVTDVDGDREGGTHYSKAAAIEWARANVNSMYGHKAYILETVALVTPSNPPATVIDL